MGGFVFDFIIFNFNSDDFMVEEVKPKSNKENWGEIVVEIIGGVVLYIVNTTYRSLALDLCVLVITVFIISLLKGDKKKENQPQPTPQQPNH